MYFCNMEFSEFILAHDADDLGRLALSRDRWAAEVSDFELALSTLECRRKLRTKVPEWVAVPSLRYPFRLSAEQCSSSETARYKASVIPGARRVADLTGGMGVDSWAFAQRYQEVLYNEMRPELAKATAFNLRELGLHNVIVRNEMLVRGNLDSILEGFVPDAIFLDPARRAADGRKVFRLEDCEPDVLQLLPELLQACPLLLLKLSPMADISLVCKQLGCVKQVHVVAAEGECKELLLLLEKGYAGAYSLTVFQNGHVLEVTPSPACLPAPGVEPGAFVFEPGKALLKAGAFDLPGQYGLQPLGKHTHLYAGASVPEVLRPFGKVFEVLEVAPLNKRSIREIGRKYPQAEVTARNVPLTSDGLRIRLGVRSGGNIHIFGVHVDTLSANYLLISRA